ncbi:hypothetical protein [Chryseobacterium rhizosphaerae]|uniref:hypothetical protein n=1 Tax=Chryseobacterium rhizosphaerae TaxID=395937 RepID=UPI00235850E1|nr:hypothetical protein [Chryseobacterium rhizosphaerae]MDC8099429.1 hypothetical protein [Chryseobacterium rhizosphaerae]
MAQNNFKVLTKEVEQANYNLRDLKFYKTSPYNESLAYFIDENNLLVQPNVPAAEHSLILSISDFDSNKFPLLPENDTPYYRYKELMNKEGFTKENMLKILDEVNFNYQKETFYTDAEKFVKTLSLDDKMKFFIPALYFIGEDLHKLCPNAEWQFHTLHYFQPFSDAGLYYEKRQFSFYDLNVLLEEKLLKDKKITFKNIYKRVEKYYLKEKPNWNYTIELVPRSKD